MEIPDDALLEGPIPSPEEAPWVAEMLDELATFVVQVSNHDKLRYVMRKIEQELGKQPTGGAND